MKDVAAAAGVGIGTVSRVFSGGRGVSQATREKVERAAQELDFRPNALGRSLMRQGRQDIGLLVADISNSFYGEFAKGVLSSAQAIGRHVLLCASGEDETLEREYIQLLVDQRVTGIIAFPTGRNVAEWRNARRLGINVVFADRTIDGFNAPSVVVDNSAGMSRLTEYLLAVGHRRVGYLGGPHDVTSGRLREEGFRSAHADAGIDLAEELVVRTPFTRDAARASALRLLQVVPRPTALVAANNILGEAALGAIRDSGLRVPDDISVAMFDDVPWASLVEPPMTVVAQPAHELGQLATRMVLKPRTDHVDDLIVETELIIRGSTKSAPPKARGA